MLSAKRKGLFIETNEFSTLLALTSGLDAPFTLESVHELKPDMPAEELKEMVASLSDGKAKFTDAKCGIYPDSRFVRRHTLDSPGKAKDPAFFPELLKSQYRIDVNENMAAVISAASGRPFNPEENLQQQKELVLCGAKLNELREHQSYFVEASVFPQRMELGTLATLAGIKHYVRQAEINYPVMILEVMSNNSNVFILSKDRLDISRPIPYGLNSMFPLIQKELKLKDETSAKKLFYSNTFDFTEMGPSLLKKIMKELQASTGFYEVQTGQTIGYLFTTLLPQNFNWLTRSLSRSLGVDVLRPDFGRWLRSMGIKVGEGVRLESLDSRWLSLFSLMIDFSREAVGEPEPEPVAPAGDEASEPEKLTDNNAEQKNG